MPARRHRKKSGSRSAKVWPKRVWRGAGGGGGRGAEGGGCGGCNGECAARERSAVIVRRSTDELNKLRRSGLLVYQILEDLRQMACEGVTTHDLEMAAEKKIADAG